MKRLLLLWSLIVASCQLSAMEAVEGRHYRVLEQPLKAYENRVVEFYNYACVYCYRVEDAVADIKSRLPENYEFEQVPLVLGKGNRFITAAYAGWMTTFLGHTSARERKYFFQVARSPVPWELKKYNRLSSMEDLKIFLSDIGVDSDALKKAELYAFNKISETEAFAQAIKLRSTPAFLIDGKYVVEGLLPKPFAEYLLRDLVVHLARSSNENR